MGAVDQSGGEDNETINSSRKVEDVLTAGVLDKIGAPGCEVLSIEDDIWPEAHLTTRSTTAGILDGCSRPTRALASSEIKYESSLSNPTYEQGLSSDSLSSASFVGSRLHRKIGSSKVPEAAGTGMGNSMIDRHALVRTDVRSSVLVTGADSFPGKATGARVFLKPTSTGGTDPALPPSQSTSEDDQLNSAGLDERRQKRMLSNRESARRSRLRKQQHLDELRAEVDQLQAEKTSMVATYNAAAEQFSQLTGENNALRKHAEDLYQKILKLREKDDGVSPDWSRALDIEQGDQGGFAADHLSVYLQPSLPGTLPRLD